MFLKYIINYHPGRAPEVAFKYVGSMFSAERYIDSLMDSQLPGKQYTDFELVNETKERVIKKFDMNRLIIEMNGRAEKKKRREKERGKGRQRG